MRTIVYKILGLIYFMHFGYMLSAQNGPEFKDMVWQAQGMSMQIPSFLENIYVQEDECGGIGGGLRLEMIHVGAMDVREDLSFFEGILVFQTKEPTDVWKASFPARLISGFYEGTRIWVLAFNNAAGEAYAAIAYFDDDNAVMEETVRKMFRSIQWKL
jgi:hypothetical protein